MFPCNKGHFIRAYLDTISMTLGKPTTKLWTKFDSESMQRLQIDSEGEVSLESLHGNAMVNSWLKLFNDNRKQFSISKNSQ